MSARCSHCGGPVELGEAGAWRSTALRELADAHAQIQELRELAAWARHFGRPAFALIRAAIIALPKARS